MRLLDLYCGAGGAAMGYHRAGFTDIVGIDLEPQPDYPFAFVQANALLPPLELADFDLIHASPPCQALSTMGNRWRSPRWGNLIAPTRELMQSSGVPYVLENVAGAISHMVNPIRLTGESFGLSVHRARLFELGEWWALTPPQPRRNPAALSVYGKPDGRRLWDRVDGSRLSAWQSIAQGQAALGTPWITDPVGIAEAIPPAYTQWIGEQYLAQVGAPSG